MSPIPLGIFAAAGISAGGFAYELISTLTGAGNPTSFTFSSIPATYKHLQLRIVGRTTTGGAGSGPTSLRLNGDSSSTYNNYFFWSRSNAIQTGAGSATSIDTYNYPDNLQAANIFATSIIDIADYAASTKIKTVKIETGTNETSLPTITLSSGYWPSTAAITSVTWLSTSGRTFDTASRVSLYGIRG